jgi:hypothetical protein
MAAISSKGTANMSCSTKASRSAEASVSSTTSSARPTESARAQGHPVLAAHDRLRHVRAQGLLAPRPARAQHVEAHPRDDRRHPSAEVLDAARTGAAEMEPGLLHGDVRLARRAEHRVRPQVGPVGLELLRQRVVLVHRSHSSSRSVITVTNETQPDVTRRTESEPRRSASRSASDRPLDVTTRHLAGSGPAGRHRAARSSLQQGQTNQGGGAELPAFGALPRIRSIRTSLE